MSEADPTLPRFRDDVAKAPGDLYFAPGVDPGLATIGPLPRMWARHPVPRIAALPASAHPRIQAALTERIAEQLNRRSFRMAARLGTVPVRAEDLSADGHFLAVRGKWLLSGAAGKRMRNRHLWAREPEDVEPEVRASMQRVQAADPPPPPVAGGDASGLDLVIDARNGTNFFHVLTETLGQLELASAPGFDGAVHVHVKKPEVAGFVRPWIAALYPELAGRVDFRSGRHHYPRALTGLGARHWYFMSGPATMEGLDALGANADRWRGRGDAGRQNVDLLEMNSCEDAHLALRARAGALLEGQGDAWDHLPRRFLLARRDDPDRPARHRPIAGEAALWEELRALGFERLIFEDLPPAGQIAAMARAEVMVGAHGAGFANLLFAGRDTHCIELGNLQTALTRWQDFLPLAIASGCRYTSVFADADIPDPARADALWRSKALPPVRLEAEGREALLAFVDTLIGRARARPIEHLRREAEALSRLEDHAALARLLDANSGAEAADPDLAIARANACKAAGDATGEEAALDRAWAMTGDRPFLLERLILCRAGQPAEAAALVDLHRARWPNRARALRRRLAAARAPAGHQEL